MDVAVTKPLTFAPAPVAARQLRRLAGDKWLAVIKRESTFIGQLDGEFSGLPGAQGGTRA